MKACYDTELGVSAAGSPLSRCWLRAGVSQVSGSEQDLVTQTRGVKSPHSEAAKQKKHRRPLPRNGQRRMSEDKWALRLHLAHLKSGCQVNFHKGRLNRSLKAWNTSAYPSSRTQSQTVRSEVHITSHSATACGSKPPAAGNLLRNWRGSKGLSLVSTSERTSTACLQVLSAVWLVKRSWGKKSR